MTIKQRLIKLESSLMPETTNYHIMRMVIDTDDKKVIGYQCQDTEIYKRDDESSTQFRARLHDSVDWPIGKSSRHIFEPIFAE